MRTFQLKQGDLYLSTDFGRELSVENASDAQQYLDTELFLWFDRRPDYKQFIDLYGKLNQLERYAMLAAHGSDNGKWTYFDEEKRHTVQSWINTVDGNYSALLLNVCNPGGYTPASRKSILIVPDGNIGFNSERYRNTIFTLLVPQLGEVDSNTVGYEMSRLQRQIE